MCLLPVTDHPTHRRTDKPFYRDAWTLDTSKIEWRWGYFINIKQKTEDNTETLFTAKILALTSIFEGFYARYRATSIDKGCICSHMAKLCSKWPALILHCIIAWKICKLCTLWFITPKILKRNAHSGPGSSCIRSSEVILMPIFGFPTIILVYQAKQKVFEK